MPWSRKFGDDYSDSSLPGDINGSSSRVTMKLFFKCGFRNCTINLVHLVSTLKVYAIPGTPWWTNLDFLACENNRFQTPDTSICCRLPYGIVSYKNVSTSIFLRVWTLGPTIGHNILYSPVRTVPYYRKQEGWERFGKNVIIYKRTNYTNYNISFF